MSQWFCLTLPSGSRVSGERAVTRVSCGVKGSINYPENQWPLHFLGGSVCPRLLPDPVLSISVPVAPWSSVTLQVLTALPDASIITPPTSAQDALPIHQDDDIRIRKHFIFLVLEDYVTNPTPFLCSF